MTRQAPWFHSFVPRDVGGCIRMSEAFGYSTLLVSTTYDVQQPLACPDIHYINKKKAIQVAVTYKHTVPLDR